MPQPVKKKQNKSSRESARRKLIAITRVKRAHENDTPSEVFLEQCSFQIKAIQCKVEHYKKTFLSDESLKWVFQLTEDNMKEMYNECSLGWNGKNKFAELASENAHYLLVSDLDGNPLAYSHFRYDVDYGDTVLYCYELQVSKTVQRGGLGTKLLLLLELLAREAHMSYVRMTVFNHNQTMNDFVKKMGYTVDKTSPLPDEKQPYTIVSKKLEYADTDEAKGS